jgi:cutinase
VATEGINYAALLETYFNPGGADYAGIAQMHNLLIDAAGKCPNSKLVAGGYSQGAALTHRAIEDLPDSVKQKIVGAITYGDTQNQQDNGQIPNFPKDKVKIICNVGDLVCQGSLVIAAPHLAYQPRVGEAVDFGLKAFNKEVRKLAMGSRVGDTARPRVRAASLVTSLYSSRRGILMTELT